MDWVVEKENALVPVEVKWTSSPSEKDCRHLRIFLSEYKSPKGFLVCRTPRRLKLDDKIDAIPWQEIPELVR